MVKNKSTNQCDDEVVKVACISLSHIQISRITASVTGAWKEFDFNQQQ